MGRRCYRNCKYHRLADPHFFHSPDQYFNSRALHVCGERRSFEDLRSFSFRIQHRRLVARHFWIDRPFDREHDFALFIRLN